MSPSRWGEGFSEFCEDVRHWANQAGCEDTVGSWPAFTVWEITTNLIRVQGSESRDLELSEGVDREPELQLSVLCKVIPE